MSATCFHSQQSLAPQSTCRSPRGYSESKGHADPPARRARQSQGTACTTRTHWSQDGDVAAGDQPLALGKKWLLKTASSPRPGPRAQAPQPPQAVCPGPGGSGSGPRPHSRPLWAPAALCSPGRPGQLAPTLPPPLGPDGAASRLRWWGWPLPQPGCRPSPTLLAGWSCWSDGGPEHPPCAPSGQHGSTKPPSQLLLGVGTGQGHGRQALSPAEPPAELQTGGRPWGPPGGGPRPVWSGGQLSRKDTFSARSSGTWGVSHLHRSCLPGSRSASRPCP